MLVSIVMGIPHNGWFIMENPIKIDDLELPPIYGNPLIIITIAIIIIIISTMIISCVLSLSLYDICLYYFISSNWDVLFLYINLFCLKLGIG